MSTVRCPRALWRRTAAHAGGEGLGQTADGGTAPWRRGAGVVGRALVAAVEAAQEVAPVAAIEGEQGGRLAEDAGRDRGAIGHGQVAGGEPGVGLDHVRCHQSVLEVEGGQVAVGRQDGGSGPVGAVRHRTGAGVVAHPGVLDHRGQVHVVDVGGPRR